MPPLDGQRIVILGAETELGQRVTTDLAKAGAILAVVSASGEASSAFEVQRLGRRLGALSQAIDATNEAAVRVMLRQIAKDLGGIDAAVSCIDDVIAGENFERHARREMTRTGEGAFVDAIATPDVVAALAG